MPALVQQMKDLGFDRVSADQLTAMRIHGVTPDFIQAMRTFIRGNISIDDLMGLRIHGVTPEFIKEIEILGYSNLSADQLVGFRIHGVTSSYIQTVQSFGYKPTADQLVGLRIHGVTPDFIETVRSRGFNDVTIAQHISFRALARNSRVSRNSCGNCALPPEFEFATRGLSLKRIVVSTGGSNESSKKSYHCAHLATETRFGF
jgi:hypothetical protein